MSKITIELNDEAAKTIQTAAQAAHQAVESWARETICQAASRAVGAAQNGRPRVFPLHPGAIEILPGFSEPLEEFSPYV